MYKNSPKIYRKFIFTISACFSIFGIFVFGIAGATPLPAAVLQFLGFAMLGVGLLLLINYGLKEYIYEVKPKTSQNDEGVTHGYEFSVYAKKNNREILECKLNSTQIATLQLVTQENKKELAQKRRGKRCFNYDAQFGAVIQIEIISLDNEHIILTYDEKLFELLGNCLDK